MKETDYKEKEKYEQEINRLAYLTDIQMAKELGFNDLDELAEYVLKESKKLSVLLGKINKIPKKGLKIEFEIK